MASGAAAPSSESTDGPVLSVINKRIRALKKKLNRINQTEEAVAQGKPINKEQEDVLRSKPSIVAAIDELEKLRQPLSTAVQDEVRLALQNHTLPPLSTASASEANSDNPECEEGNGASRAGDVLEDLLNLLYFGSLFDVKSQGDFTATMLTRTHERECCLTYDYVSDDATDPLVEPDLDLISMLGCLLISRPADSSLSHKNALQRCLEHAKLWLENSDHPIDPNANISYAQLKKRLNKIMALDYFTTTPAMKGPVEVAAAAAAGNYAPFQVPGVSISVPGQLESSGVQYQPEDETENFEGHETGVKHSSTAEELHKDELEAENTAEVVSDHQEYVKAPAEFENNERDVEYQEQQYGPRRSYPNQRGGRGGGGRRGYSNGRGGRTGGRGGSGGYQNGRSQYHDQPGNFYPRNYNNRGRGNRGGGQYNNNHGSAQGGGADRVAS